MMPSFEDIKKIATVLQEAGKLDLYEKLLEIKQQAMEMQEKIEKLSSENRNLSRNLNIKGNLELVDNHYWLKDQGKLDGPYCTKCWDKEQLLIRVPTYNDNAYQFECPNCQTKIKNKNYVPPSPSHFNNPFDF